MTNVFPGNRKKQAPSNSLKSLADDTEFTLKYKGYYHPTTQQIRDCIELVMKEHTMWGKGYDPNPMIKEVQLELSRRGGKVAGDISHRRALAKKARLRANDPQMWLPLGDTKPVQTFLI